MQFDLQTAIQLVVLGVQVGFFLAMVFYMREALKELRTISGKHEQRLNAGDVEITTLKQRCELIHGVHPVVAKVPR